MKIVSAATLLVALFVASVITTSVTLLSNLDQPTADIRIEDLNAGQLLPMLCGPTLWNQYPSFPPAAALVQPHAMCLVGGLVAVAFYLFRIKLQQPVVVASIASLLLSAFPYAQGLYMLQTRELEPSEAGPWVALMLLGVFYASASSAVLAMTELTGWHTKVRALLRTDRRRLFCHAVRSRS